MKPYDAHLHVCEGPPPAGCVAAGDPKQNARAEVFAREHHLHLALGVHPWWADQVDTAATLRNLDLLPLDAIGEFGLDALRGDRAAQERSVELQLAYARSRNLPVVLHCVRAHDRLYALLRGHPVSGMVHAWTGNVQQGERFLDLGLYLSFGGALLRSPKISRVAERVPPDRLLIESDSTSGEACVEGVVEALAAIRGWSTEVLVRTTDRNARRLFPRDPRSG